MGFAFGNATCEGLMETVEKTLINSTVTANCCVMRYSKCSHMSEYAVLSVLLLLALHSPQRITQSLLDFVFMAMFRFCVAMLARHNNLESREIETV